MIPIGDAAFVAARLQRMIFKEMPKSLDDVEAAAREAELLHLRMEIADRQDALDRIWAMADSFDLVDQHGADAVTTAMTAGITAARDAFERDRDDAAILEADRKNEAALGLQITPISQIDIRAIEWLWPDRIALGKLLLLAGNGGIGKSTLLFDIAARVSRGQAWPDGTRGTVPQSVFLLSSEDDPADTIRPRLQAAGADIDKVYFLSMVRELGGGQRMFNLQADIARLEERVRQVGDVGLVSIDPVTGYLGKADGNSNTEVRRILTPLGDMAMRTRSAVIGITHFNKAQSGSASSRVLGAGAFTAVVRGNYVVTLDPNDKDRRLFLPSKFNISDKKTGLAFRIGQTLVKDKHGQKTIRTTQVLWESGDIAMTADDALGALDKTDDGEAKSAKEEAVAFLKEVLADGPQVSTEVMAQAQALGLTEKPLRVARKELGVKAVRAQHTNNTWLWALPA